MYLFWILVRVFIFVFIPSFLAYLGTDHNIIDSLKEKDILGEAFDIPLIKQMSLVIGITISNLILIVIYEVRNFQYRVARTRNLSLINDLKMSFLLALGNEIKDQHVNSIRFRVWKSESYLKVFLNKIKNRLSRKKNRKIFKVKNIEGLSDLDNTKGLYFEVYPNLQGLVGKCYNERALIYKEDISNLNDEYNLTPFQIHKTRNAKFCMAIPLFNKNDQIVSIISLDCIYSIKIPEESESIVADMLMTFIQDLNRYIPKLFK